MVYERKTKKKEEEEKERERERERDSRIILVTSNMNFYIDERIRRETL